MLNCFLANRLVVAALTLLSFTPVVANAQGAGAPPPAHTYHVDQYGRETRVVKERWAENSNGEKQGVYLRYAPDGTPTAKILYSNGVKNGPSYEVLTDEWRLTKKFVGSYLNGNKDGWWSTYYVGKDGQQGALYRKEQYVAGDLRLELTYRDGRNTGVYSWARNRRNGPAKVFGNTPLEFGTGTFTNGNPSGTWLNATFDDNPILKQIIYQKGAKLLFENGELVSTTDANGVVRSLTVEKAQAVAEATKRGAEQEARNEDARLSYIKTDNLGLRFNTDSYVMTRETVFELDKLAKEINLRRESAKYRIKEIYIAVYIGKPRGEISEGSTKMMYVLTVNRASAMKDYLLTHLTDRTIPITTYPCGYDSNTNSAGTRVEIELKRDTFVALPRAKAAYETLASKYNIKSDAGLIPSTILQENILNTLRAYFNDEGVRSLIGAALAGNSNMPEYAEKIPSELWLSDLGPMLPKAYAQVENVEQFRRQVESLVSELNKKYRDTLPASAFFNQDLKQRTKQ